MAVERKGKKLGRLRLQVIEDCSGDELIPFIGCNVEPGSQISTDGWKSYNAIGNQGFNHKQIITAKRDDKESVLSGVHLIASLVKRLILGTFQGRFEKKYLQNYLDEYVFRFNRRNTKSVGKRFYRIVQQAVTTSPKPQYQIVLGTINPLLAN